MSFEISFEGIAILIALGLLILELRKKHFTFINFRDVKFANVSAKALRIDEGKDVIEEPPLQMFTGAAELIISTIDNKAINDVAQGIDYSLRQAKPLVIVINTDGGDLIAARAICGTLKHFVRNGHDLEIIVRGKCYSAGMTILMAVGPEHRYAVDGSEFMVHSCACSVTNWRGLRSRELDDGILKVLTENSRIEHSSLAALLKSNKRCFFSAERALEMGIIGRVI